MRCGPLNLTISLIHLSLFKEADACASRLQVDEICDEVEPKFKECPSARVETIKHDNMNEIIEQMPIFQQIYADFSLLLFN